jgi:beta-galactosidase
VAPALYLIDDETVDWLAAYAHAGGHLVLGPRTAYADHEGRARAEHAPGRLNAVAGVRYDEFSNLTDDLPVSELGGCPFELPHDATATRWVEGLTTLDAEAVVGYRHPHFGQWPAVTTRRHGAGRVTYVGTIPGRSLARALAAWLAPDPVAGWADLPGSVTATTGTASGGRRVHILHNWNWEPIEIAAPRSLADALTGVPVHAGSFLRLGAWDVRVLVDVAEHADRGREDGGT